jgi:nucleotide-binding universal stress UspA family protein
VTLLHVIERIDAGDPEAFQTLYRRLENNAKKGMKSLMGELEKRGVPARAEIRFGNRVSEILRFAEESRADLIVMISHKLRMRVPGENWGTISYKVGILSRCPVLLVK